MKFLTILTLCLTTAVFSLTEQEILDLNYDAEVIEYSENHNDCAYYGKSHRSNVNFGTFYRATCYEARSACNEFMKKYRRTGSDYSCETERYWKASARCIYEGWKDGRLNRTYGHQGFANNQSSAMSYACKYAKDQCTRSGNAYCRIKH